MREYYGLLVSGPTGWLEGFVASLPNLVAAVPIAVGFGLLARMAVRLTRRAAERWNAAEAVVSLAATVAKCLVLAAGVFVALGVLGLQKTVISLLAGAAILGLALAFAFQDIAANFVAGVLMGFRKPFAVGHIVETNDFMGTVRTRPATSAIPRRSTPGSSPSSAPSTRTASTFRSRFALWTSASAKGLPW